MHLSKNAECLGMHRFNNALHPIEEISNRDTLFKFCVFLHENVVKIEESIQDQAFRVFSERANNDLIRKDEKR